MFREEDVSFIHNRELGYTIGYVAEQRDDRIKVKAAASWCNWRDRFSKKIGRAVVTGRLNCNRDNGKLHNVEFFLSGKLPKTGDQWRAFEDAVIGQTAQAYEEWDQTE